MQNRIQLRLLQDLGVIFLLGLLPLFWFIPNHFILSVDSNLPFTLERWINEVFFSWDTHLRGGWSPRMIESTHFFFLVQWLFQWIGMDLLTTQRAVFVFWFMLPGFTQYFFLRYLFRDYPENVKRLACFAGLLFYMFNLYLEPIWLGLNVSNLLGYGFLPLLLRLWLQVLEEKRSPVIYGFVFALISLMASGIATNPANLFVSAIPFLILTLIFLFRSFKAKKGMAHLFLFLFFASLFSLLFNLYWILTEWQKVFVTSFETTKEAGQGFIVDSWVQGVSKYASFTNVIRMLGSWTWFAEPRAYNTFILHNPFFIFLSWLVPFFGLLGLFFPSRYRKLFGAILIFGIILSMGVHFPFEKIYMWMMQHIPFFWLIRSPWYKFMLLTCLGYSYFMGVAAAGIYVWGKSPCRNPQKRRRMALALSVLLFVTPPLYSYPITLGKIFLKPSESSYPNHFQVPQYVYDAGDYLEKRPENNRVWVLPGKGFFINKWGFSGFTPFLPYVVKKPILFTDHNLSIPISEQWVSAISHPFQIFQNSFEKQLSPNLYRALSLFNIDAVVAEKDFRWEALPIPYSLKEMQESLSLLRGVELEKSFGEWDVYRVADPHPLLYVARSVIYVEENMDALIPLSNTDLLKRNALFFAADLPHSEKHFLWKKDQIDHVVLFDKSAVDLAVDLMPPVEKVLLSFNGKEVPSFQFTIPEEGFYRFYASKGRAVSLTKPRSLVDKQELPHQIPFFWSPNLLEKENWLSVNQVQVKPILFEDRFEKELGEGKKWEAIGELFLEKGTQTLKLEGALAEEGKFLIQIVPLTEAQNMFQQIKEWVPRPEKGFSRILVTDPAWNHGGWAPTDPEKIVIHPQVKWVLEGKLKEVFPFQHSSQWHELEQNETALRILNNKGRETTTRLAFQALSVQPTQRELYISLNGERVHAIKIGPLEELGISVRLHLKPGENLISFQTNCSPEPLNKFYPEEDDRKVTLLLKQIQVGDLVFSSQVSLPERESFVFRVYPFSEKREGDLEFFDGEDRFLKVGTQKIPLDLHLQEEGGHFWQSRPVRKLKPGRTAIEFLEKEGKSYFIEVRSDRDGSLKRTIPDSSTTVFERKNPTLIKGTFQSEQPAWLIFSESFDPRWILTMDGKNYSPIKVNSYANAYFLPETSGKEIPFVLEFTPQKWMNKGIKISFGALIGGSLFVLFLALFKWRYRRQKKNDEAQKKTEQ